MSAPHLRASQACYGGRVPWRNHHQYPVLGADIHPRLCTDIRPTAHIVSSSPANTKDCCDADRHENATLLARRAAYSTLACPVLLNTAREHQTYRAEYPYRSKLTQLQSRSSSTD